MHLYCIKIVQLIHLLDLTDKNDDTTLAMSHFFLENSHKYLRQYDSARYYNQLRIDALLRTGDTIETVPAYISKAYYSYYIDPRH